MHDRRSQRAECETAEAASLANPIQLQARRTVSALLGLLFPSRCVSCGRVDHLLCPDCRLAFVPGQKPVCERCGQSVADGDDLCWRCREHEPLYAACRSAFRFEGTLRVAVHGLKFDGRAEVAGILAGEMVSALRREFPECETWPLDVAMPVPLHPERETARGYNQARLLLEPFAADWGLRALDNALWRVRDTRSQLGLNAHQRQENVRDAFEASEERVAGLNVLLLDDVRTTGATLEACSVALLGAGANAVYAVTLAHAV